MFQAANGNWYQVYSHSTNGASSGPPRFKVSKSTDGGNTFKDVADGPTFTLYSAVARQGTTDTLVFAYQDSTDTTINVTTFDMSTETFGVVITTGVITSSLLMLDCGLAVGVTQAGVICIAWTNTDALTITAECFAKVYSGGAWGADLHINAGVPRGTAENIVVVGSNFGILWSNWINDGNVGSSFGTRVSLFYTPVSSGVLGAAVTAMLDASKVNDAGISWPVLYPGVYDSGNNIVGFPIGQQTSPHDPMLARFEMDVLVGTNASSGSPSFSVVQVVNLTDQTNVQSMPKLVGPLISTQPLACVFGGSPGNTGYFLGVNPPTQGLFVLMWAQEIGAGNVTIENCTSLALGSGWGAEGIFFDTGLTDTDPEFFLWLNGGVSVVSLACPVLSTGVVGTQFSASLIATNGTSPYTFTLTGGALPPGLFLNAGTGVIQGTPTAAGTYSYTVQVTDSLGATATVTCSITITAPVLSSGTGGRGFIRVKANFFDSCLGREFLLYKTIDRELLKCGVKPYCFCIDERDWGGNFSEHEEVPMGPPEGALAFNPTGQISLPSPASGDNVVFSFRVPVGYDGVILGQFHGYYGVVSNSPVPGVFVEGSGDIVWRLSIAGRFGRDCGRMLVSLGSIPKMYPIAGGLQVRSENLIQYVVAAPNTSGALTPGLGNIVAALHGWMWPRR